MGKKKKKPNPESQCENERKEEKEKKELKPRKPVKRNGKKKCNQTQKPTWKGKKRRKKKKKEEEEEEEENRERWSRPSVKDKKKKKTTTVLEREKGLTVGFSMCVYLQKCHYNSVSISWKYLKYVFSFHNSSLKNQRIEW